METLEIEKKHVKVLLKKAYEWRAKINKRQHRINFFKTQHAIRRFKFFLKNKHFLFIPNNNELSLTVIWFLRCPPHNDFETFVFTLIGIIYKIHGFKLKNTINFKKK